MIQIADGFEFRDLYVYPAPGAGGSEPIKFYYFPFTPQPETDSQGRPSLLSIPINQGGFLQLGAHLGSKTPEDELLEALRSELLVRMNSAAPGTSGAVSTMPITEADRTTNTKEPLLELAPIHVTEAKLQLGNGDENAPATEDLGRSDTSGFYPFTALFSVQLNAEQQAGTIAALNGRPGVLLVRYEARLAMPVQASVRFSGDVRNIISRLVGSIQTTPSDAPGAESSASTSPTGSSAVDLASLAVALLEEAIEQGHVKVETQSSEAAPPELLQRAREDARQRMLNLLVIEARRQAQNTPAGASSNNVDLAHAEASASLTDSMNYPLSLVADVADWFGRGPTKGTDHMMLLPGK